MKCYQPTDVVLGLVLVKSESKVCYIILIYKLMYKDNINSWLYNCSAVTLCKDLLYARRAAISQFVNGTLFCVFNCLAVSVMYKSYTTNNSFHWCCMFRHYLLMANRFTNVCQCIVELLHNVWLGNTWICEVQYGLISWILLWLHY